MEVNRKNEPSHGRMIMRARIGPGRRACFGRKGSVGLSKFHRSPEPHSVACQSRLWGWSRHKTYKQRGTECALCFFMTTFLLNMVISFKCFLDFFQRNLVTFVTLNKNSIFLLLVSCISSGITSLQRFWTSWRLRSELLCSHSKTSQKRYCEDAAEW